MTILEILRALRTQRVLFAVIVASCVGASVIVALLSRPVYRSEVVIAPVPDDGASTALGGLAGQFGGLAALAGVSIGKGQSWDEAIALLRSRRMISALVENNSLLPVLFAEQWDSATRTWKASTKRPPTMGDAVLLFHRRILQVREDAKTGLVTVRIDWYDPAVAAAWANELVALTDSELRRSSVSLSSASLRSLQAELQRAESVELRTAIGRLMEQQLKAKLLAEVRESFAFRIVDPAVPADLDKRVQPTRTVMVLAGGMAGVFLALLVVVLRRDWAARSDSP